MTAFHARHVVVQLLRRCSQAAASALMLGLIFFALYHHYYAARALDRIGAVGGWRGAVLERVAAGMDAVDDPQELLRRNNGNLWSMRLAGREIADPLALVEVSAAGRRPHLPLLWAALLPIFVTIALGRVFCSWVCPGYVVFELAGKLRRLLPRIGIEPAAVAFSHTNKFALLAAGVTIALATGLPIFSMFYPPALLSRVSHAVIFGTGVSGMLLILLSLVGFEVFVSPRWWCRTMCAGGALYGLLGASRLLRVKLVADRCTACKLCQPACQEGLNPITESASLNCDNCGACVRDCPDQALVFCFGVSREQKVVAGGSLSNTAPPVSSHF